MSIEWVDETWCVCTVGYSLAIKWSPVTCNNTDEPREHFESSSHRGAHNLVFLCQLGARPRASGVTHAACLHHKFTQRPGGNTGSVLLQGPWVKGAHEAVLSSPCLTWCPLCVLRCRHLCLPLLAAPAAFPACLRLVWDGSSSTVTP